MHSWNPSYLGDWSKKMNKFKPSQDNCYDSDLKCPLQVSSSNVGFLKDDRLWRTVFINESVHWYIQGSLCYSKAGPQRTWHRKAWSLGADTKGHMLISGFPLFSLLPDSNDESSFPRPGSSIMPFLLWSWSTLDWTQWNCESKETSPPLSFNRKANTATVRLSQNLKQIKKDWDVYNSMVEHMPSTCKALSSNADPTKKNK